MTLNVALILLAVSLLILAYLLACGPRIRKYGNAIRRLMDEDFNTYLQYEKELYEEWNKYIFMIWRKLPKILQ